MPPEEVDVCLRLAMARRKVGHSQSALAERVGATRDQIANVEAKRTPLAFRLGLGICRDLNLNPLWLASGEGGEHPYFELNAGEIERVSAGSIFRLVILTRFLEELRFMALGELKAVGYGDGSEQGLLAKFEHDLASLSRVYLRAVPPGRRPELVAHITRAFAQFSVLDQERPENPTRTKGRSVSQPVVDNVLERHRLADVSKPGDALTKLIRRAKVICAQAGTQSRLARDLGVSRQAVNRWFSGDSAPSADLALRLVEWINQEESKAVNH